MNQFMIDQGYVNLDFMSNLNHSIVQNKEDRIYIEKGNHTKSWDVALFTFKPYISTNKKRYGYKKKTFTFSNRNILRINVFLCENMIFIIK